MTTLSALSIQSVLTIYLPKQLPDVGRALRAIFDA
jgi:hypothetical protein